MIDEPTPEDRQRERDKLRELFLELLREDADFVRRVHEIMRDMQDEPDVARAG